VVLNKELLPNEQAAGSHPSLLEMQTDECLGRRLTFTDARRLEGGDGCTDPSIMAGEDGWRAMGEHARNCSGPLASRSHRADRRRRSGRSTGGRKRVAETCPRSHISLGSGLQHTTFYVGFREAGHLLISRARPIVKYKDGLYCSPPEWADYGLEGCKPATVQHMNIFTVQLQLVR